MGLRTRIGVAASAGLVGAAAAAGGLIVDQSQAQPQAAAADRCSALAGTRVEAGVVETAARFAPGATVGDGETAGVKVSTAVCRVRLRLSPAPGSDIKVEVWLPERWNNKLAGIGGAGFDGGLNPGGGAMLDRLAGQGYAAVANDAGHKAGSPTLKTWVHKQPDKVLDFGYRATHLAAVTAKQLVKAYYGDGVKRAYFLACSNGGREGLQAVSRYPEDYDGVVAGAPARRYIEILSQMIWNYRAVHGPDGAPKLESKLGLVHDAVLRKCDAIDGLKDGLLENPQACRFDPTELQCKGVDAATCLTTAEVRALRKIYGGPRLRDGRQIYSGPSVGGEVSEGGWKDWITTPQTALFGQEFYRWIVYDDPTWKLQSFDLDRDYPEAVKRVGGIINADAPDLRAFARRGGKLIIYQGWDDPAIIPADTVKYYDAVRARLGKVTDDHVRLFMVPGMGHCAGGPGATSFDMQPVLEKWVEQGKAPERVIAVKPGAEPAFSRPLCAWPKTARYNGAGSARDAANFTCKAP